MLDVRLILVLVLAAVPGVAIAVPGTLDALREQVARSAERSGRTPPSRPVLVTVGIVQSLVLVAVAAAVGTLTRGRVGLTAPFFEALAHGGALGPALWPQVLPALGLAVLGAVPFLAAYLWLVRPRLDAATREAWDTLRLRLGMGARVLYGGVVEEILSRWGITTLLAYLLTLLAGAPTPAVIWLAIVLGGLAFGILHAPSYLAAGARPTPLFYAAMLGLNLWASLVFGWLYWQHGLFAAMLAHAVFHLLWWPFDAALARRRAAGATAPPTPGPAAD